MQGVAFMLVEAKLALHAADLIEFTPVLIGGQRSLVIRHQLVEPITPLRKYSAWPRSAATAAAIGSSSPAVSELTVTP